MALLEGGALEPWLARLREFADNLCWALVKPCLKLFWIPLIERDGARLAHVQWRADKVIEERLKALDLAGRKEAMK